MKRSQQSNQRKPGKHKSMHGFPGILLPAILALPGISVSINARAADNLLVGSGGSSSGPYMLGGGGGIGGGGGAWFGGGGGGIAGGGGSNSGFGGDGGGATVAVVIGYPSGAGGIGGGGGFGSGGGGGAIGGSGGNTYFFDGVGFSTLAGGIAGQTTGASGGNGSGTTPGPGGVYGGAGGGTDSAGGGGGTVVDGNGAVISGQTPGAGANGAASLAVSSNRSYAYVGVGGGGAGGGSTGTTGTAGSAGSLTVDSGAAFTVSRSMLIGGGGGGGGLSGGGGGGTTGGGDGTVAVNNGGLAVSEILLVGGSGGGGNGNGGSAQDGGRGGSGTLALDHSTLSSATFLVGGNGGDAGTWGGSAGGAGSGTATLTNTTATVSGGVAVGGIGGRAGMINGPSIGHGGTGGNGTLTLDQTTMSVGGDMLIGNRGGDGNIIPAGGPSGNGVSGVGGTGVVTVTQSSLAIAHTLYIGGNGGNGALWYNPVEHTAGAGGTGLLSVERSTLDLWGDIFVGGNGGASYRVSDPNSRANNGGNGGNGVLTISNGIVNVQGGNLVLGGQQGTAMQAGATASAAGTGILNLGAGSLNFSGGASFTIKAGSAFNVGNAVVNGVAGGAITGLSSVSNNGVINFNQADSRYVFNPGTTGTGSVLQNSAGTTVVAGAMTHTGGTTINAGKLQIGNGGSAGSVSGNITDNATLSFNRQDTVTYAGIISGSGNLLNEGSGTTILTGSNLYSGGTTVTAGTLQFGDGGTSGSVLGNIVNNGTVAFNRSDSFTYSNIISGSGNLVKSGSGTLSIVGGNAYTGNTTVRGGILQFDSFTQSAGSSIGIATSGTGNYGKLVVSGVASLPGNAKINVDVAGVNTLALGQVLSGVISAGTLNASTFVVNDNSALFNFRADLVGNSVNLTTLLGLLPSSAVMANGPSPATGAARVMDDAVLKGASGDMGTVVTAMGALNSEREVGRAISQMLPLVGGGITSTMHGMLGSFNRALQNRIAAFDAMAGPSGVSSGVSSGEAGADRHLWSTAFGSRANQGDRDGAAGFSANSWGLMFGLDGELNRDTTIGLAYAHSNSRINGNTTFTDTAQRADIDSHLVAFYGRQSLSDDVQLDGQVDVGRNRIDGARNISFGGLNRTATSNYVSYSAHVGTALSKNIALSERAIFTPGLRVDYTWLRTPGYDEAGAAALNLNVIGNTAQALVLTAEGRLRHALTQTAWLTAHLGIGYDALNSRDNIVSTFAGMPGQSFVTPGAAHSPWLVSGGVGYAMQAGANTQVSLRYDVEGRDGYLNQAVALKANWSF